MTSSAVRTYATPTPLEHCDDAVIAARIREGDAAAFERLFRFHGEALHRYVCRFVRSPETAQDLVQDVFATLWERRSTWVVRDGIQRYLFAAVRYRAADHLRHCALERRLRTAPVIGDTVPWMGAAEPAADVSVQAAEDRAAVQRAVDGLPLQYREILAFRARDHLRYAEIASRLGIPVRTVETRVRRALQKLRERLRSDSPRPS